MAQKGQMQLVPIQDAYGRTRQVLARQPSPQELQHVIARFSMGDLSRAVSKNDQLTKRKSDCGCNGAGVDKATVREIIRTEIRSALGNVNAGRVSWGDRDQYSPGGNIGGEPGKGGVLASDSVEIPDGAAAGTEIVGAWSGTALAKMTGEMLCSLTALMDNALLDYADHLEIEILLNNEAVPSIKTIPGDYVAKTATGEIQRYPLGGWTPPYDSVVGYRVRVVHDIPDAASGGPGAVSMRLRAEVGESCPTSK